MARSRSRGAPSPPSPSASGGYVVDVTNPNQQVSLYTNLVGNVTSYVSPALTAGHRYLWRLGIVTGNGDDVWNGLDGFTLA
jgi:hypothetical protein